MAATASPAWGEFSSARWRLQVAGLRAPSRTAGRLRRDSRGRRRNMCLIKTSAVGSKADAHSILWPKAGPADEVAVFRRILVLPVVINEETQHRAQRPKVWWICIVDARVHFETAFRSPHLATLV